MRSVYLFAINSEWTWIDSATHLCLFVLLCWICQTILVLCSFCGYDNRDQKGKLDKLGHAKVIELTTKFMIEPCSQLLYLICQGGKITFPFRYLNFSSSLKVGPSISSSRKSDPMAYSNSSAFYTLKDWAQIPFIFLSMPHPGFYLLAS